MKLSNGTEVIPSLIGKNIQRKLSIDVTVEQLLNHTSGVPDYFDESVMDEYEELWVDYPNYKIRHNSDLKEKQIMI